MLTQISIPSPAVSAGGSAGLRGDWANQRSVGNVLLVLAAAVAALVWFASLAGRSLISPDEGRYATLALHMLASGDWVTPRLDGILYFEKPALQYWIGAIAYALLGVNEFAARLWPGLAGFLTVLAVGWTGARLYGREAGIQALAICASCLWIVGNAHFLTLDAGLAFFLTLTLCAVLMAELAHADGRVDAQRRWMLLAWAAMAGAVLSKGLVGILIPGATLVLASVWRRDTAIWRRMRWLPGLALFMLLTVPWFVAVSSRNPGFAEFFFIHEHFARYLTNVHRRGGVWWYYLPLLLVGFFPWTSTLPWLGRREEPEAPGIGPRHLLVAWSLFVLLFFSASDSKLPSYILPMFPALALLLASRLRATDPSRLRRHLAFPVLVWLLAAAAATQVARFASEKSPIELLLPISHAVMLGALLFVLAAVMAWWLLDRRRITGAVVALALGQLLASTLAMQSYDAFGQIETSRVIAQRLAGELQPDTPVFAVRAYDQTLPFYLRRDVILADLVDEFGFGLEREPWHGIPTLYEFAVRWCELPQAAAYMELNTWHELQRSGLPMRVVFQDARRVVVVKP